MVPALAFVQVESHFKKKKQIQLNGHISGPYTCSLAGQAVLGLEFGVVSEEDCAQLCWETEGCTYYSYYSVDSSPLQLACAKLSECNDRTSDPSVVSGPSDCNGIAVVSESYPMCFNIGTSWVHETETAIPDVSSVEECQSLCLQSSECIAFTWHKESEAFGSKLCELFPTIGETSGDCSDCVSGPKSCICSRNISCSFDEEFFINILTEIATEEECQDLCAREPSAPGTPGTPLRVGLSVKLVLSCQSVLRAGRSWMEVSNQVWLIARSYCPSRPRLNSAPTITS